LPEQNETEVTAAAKALGIRKVDGKHEFDHKSLLNSMGGWVGIAESILPGFAFVIVFSITTQAVTAVVVAAALSVAFILYRFISKKPLMGAVAGLIGVAIAVFLALREGGSSRDYFLTGFVTNLSYLVPLTLSVLIRWPLIGVLVGFLLGEKTSWRKNRYEMRVFTAATLVWVGLFGARLAVQWPLYLADNLSALATARLVMGLPLYAAALWLTWMMVRTVIHRRS
jgi:hypothetical protein